METYDPKRRTVLRGTLAAGITLALLGCNAREEDTASTPNTNPSSPGTDTAKADTPSSNKMSQEQARYQESPMDDQKCGNCANFLADSSTCRVVEGQVSSQGWCIIWAA